MTVEGLFLTVLNRALAAGWIVLALLALRPFLRKVSRGFCCAAWGLAAFRLLCPFTLQSVLSLVPDAQPAPVSGEARPFDLPIGAESSLPTASVPAETGGSSVFAQVIATLWLVGVAVLILYAVWSFVRLHLTVREAVRHPGGYWVSDRIGTPCLVGLFRPRIVLPVGIDEGDVPYILAHEKAHQARLDPWRKLIAYGVCAVFWFQPLLWAAYFLFQRDVEFACDERALRGIGADLDRRKRYARALLNGSSPRLPDKARLVRPLMFGGYQVQRRVRSVLTYRRPTAVRVCAAVVVCAAVSACFLTDPVSLAQELPVVSTATAPAEDPEPAHQPELPVQKADTPTLPDPILVSDEKVSEEGFAAYREQWLATVDYPCTEASIWFRYLWGGMKQYWLETPEGSVMVFNNPSPEDITLSFQYESHEYKSPDEYTDEDWAVAADPHRTPPYTVTGTYDVTLVVPAKDTAGVLIPIECGRGGYITISRGGFTVNLAQDG